MPKRTNHTQSVATGIKVHPVVTVVVGAGLLGAGAFANHNYHPARAQQIRQPVVEQGLNLDFNGQPKTDKGHPFRSALSHVGHHLKDPVHSIAHGVSALAHHSRTSASGHSSQH